jgi:thiamine-phosphate pyrophosphorylase
VTLNRSEVPPLYALTRSEPPLADVRALVAAGLRWIQIRDKSSPDSVLFEDLRQAKELARNVRLFVNDRVDLALASGLDGVHLGSSDLDPLHARLVAGPRPLLVGYSTHDAQEAIDAANRPEVDYVAIGPIFSSPTKNVREPLGVEVIRRIRESISIPIIAIGGINPSNIAAVLGAGADSAAVISSLYANGDVAGNVRSLMDAAGSAR